MYEYERRVDGRAAGKGAGAVQWRTDERSHVWGDAAGGVRDTAAAGGREPGGVAGGLLADRGVRAWRGGAASSMPGPSATGTVMVQRQCKECADEREAASEPTMVQRQVKGAEGSTTTSPKKTGVEIKDPVVEVPKDGEPLHDQSTACLFHVHGNENQSLEAAFQAVAKYNVNLVFIRHKERYVTLNHGGSSCHVDPNRMFPVVRKPDDVRGYNERADINAQINKKDNVAPDAFISDDPCADTEANRSAIVAFRSKVYEALQRATHNGRDPILALHNNDGGDVNVDKFAHDYGVDKAGVVEPDTSKKGKGHMVAPDPHVFSGGTSSRTAHDLLVVTDQKDYDLLSGAKAGSPAAGKLNAYLQDNKLESQGGNLDEDGSASVLFRNTRYLNLEIMGKPAPQAFKQLVGECMAQKPGLKVGGKPYKQTQNMAAIDIVAGHLGLTRRGQPDCESIASTIITLLNPPKPHVSPGRGHRHHG